MHVEHGSDPITGSVVYPDGAERAFAGWIELTAALEEAHHAEALEVSAHGDEVAEAPGQVRPARGTEIRDD